MNDEKVKEIMLRSAARSMEVEGADYDRVLKRMQARHQARLAKKQKKDS